MQTKKWKNITIVSLIAIVVEVVLLFVLVAPAIKSNKLFKNIEAGKEKKAVKVYDEMSKSQQKRVRKKLDDFGTYQVNQYIEGKKTYDDIIDSLEVAAELDDDTEDIMEIYIGKAASIELVKLYETAVAEYIKDDGDLSDLFDECDDKFYDIWYDLDDTDAADEELCDYLNAKYDDYKAGNMDAETMNMYAEVGYYYVFAYSSDAFDLSSDIVSDMYYVRMYEDDLAEAQEYYDNEEYFDCIEACEDELDWYFYDDKDETGYKEKFQALYDDAYETGKTYYLSQAEDLINSGDIDGGKDLLYDIEDVYGDDVDTSSVWELTRGAWMTPYVEFMDNWEENLRSDVASADAIGPYDDPKTLDMDTYLPDEIYLYDIDGNGTPELMLAGDDYTYFIYTYDGSNVVFTGAIRIASLAGDSQIVAEPISAPDGIMQAYELLTFVDNTWTVGEYYMTDGETYEVNGVEATEEEAEALYNEFYDMKQSVYLDYDYIDDYEDFIYSYED
jgi:biopolymer transport protein ExbD